MCATLVATLAHSQIVTLAVWGVTMMEDLWHNLPPAQISVLQVAWLIKSSMGLH